MSCQREELSWFSDLQTRRRSPSPLYIKRPIYGLAKQEPSWMHLSIDRKDPSPSMVLSEALDSQMHEPSSQYHVIWQETEWLFCFFSLIRNFSSTWVFYTSYGTLLLQSMESPPSPQMQKKKGEEEKECNDEEWRWYGWWYRLLRWWLSYRNGWGTSFPTDQILFRWSAAPMILW